MNKPPTEEEKKAAAAVKFAPEIEGRVRPKVAEKMNVLLG